MKCHNLYQWHTANKKIELLPLSLKLYSTTVCSLNVKEYSVRKQNSGIQPTTKKIATLKLNYSLNASEKTEQHHHDSSDEDEEVQFSELHNF